AQRIYLQAGTPQHNSLTNFFANFFDYDHAAIVNRGIVHSIVYSVSKLVGYVLLWPFHLALGTMNLIQKGIRTLTRQPLTRYYFLRNGMHLYWAMVTNIFNAIITNMKI